MKELADAPVATRPLALVVDDFPDGREITRCVLQSLGFHTLEVANGHDALARAKESLPDLVVLDLAMPGIDGWEVARRLRSDSDTAPITILGYTAQAEAGPVARALEAGCDEVLIKPCAPKELADSVRRLMLDPAVTARRRNDG